MEKYYPWDEELAKACINRTRGKITGNKITHPGPGIKVLGAIDYLVNYKKYVYMGQPTKKQY